MLRLSEAASKLGVAPSTLRAFADRGLIAFTEMPNGERRFQESAVEAFRAGGESPTPSREPETHTGVEEHPNSRSHEHPNSRTHLTVPPRVAPSMPDPRRGADDGEVAEGADHDGSGNGGSDGVGAAGRCPVGGRRVDPALSVGASARRPGRPAAAADRPDGWDEAVAAILARFDDGRVVPGGTGHCEAQLLHQLLAREHGFPGSYQAVRRYLRRQFPPRVQAIRRVETPPGVQAQHDGFDFTACIAGDVRALHGLIGTLSHSRARFVWVSPVMTQLAWQTGHLALFQRYGGVPLWIRVDNLKTAVAQGAGPTAVLTPAFAAFARQCGFAIDPCRPATGSDKGKVERGVRSARSAFADLFVQSWASLEQLQAALDGRAAERHGRDRCPVTGTMIAEALTAERALLQPVPWVHEPFDCVVARRVMRDGLVSFEGRRYSVPFAWIGHTVEVRGTAPHVLVLADGAEIARHPRHTTARLLLTPAHDDGPSTAQVRAPTPLGRRARQQVLALPGVPAQVGRSLQAYVALIDATRREEVA